MSSTSVSRLEGVRTRAHDMAVAYTQTMDLSVRTWAVTAVLIASVATGAVVAADDVEVTFSNGRVTLTAHDATVKAILEQWAIAGDTKFVDADQLKTVVRLQLIDIPEAEALRVLLRDAAGFVAAPRSAVVSDVSTYDRVVIMPESRQASSVPLATQLPTARTMPGVAPIQGASPRTIPNANVNLADRLAGGDLEELREILPQPLQSGGARPAASPNGQDDPRPVVASRPGMPVTTTEDQAPTFIRRPVRPQDDDPSR